jgi:hypothetical protein
LPALAHRRTVALARAARKLGAWVVDLQRNPPYSEYVKNITVSLDDETYRRARMIAAERDTSVSALVRQFLVELAQVESEHEQLKREERLLRERITTFRASDRLSRDHVHKRER